MKPFWRWVAAAVALLVVLHFARRAFFPDNEALIKARMEALAGAVSFDARQAPLTLLANANQAAGFLTPDVRVSLSGYGLRPQTLNGRDEVRQVIEASRSVLPGLSIKFPDLRVSVNPDGQSATVYANANGRAGGQDLQLIELRFTLRRIDGDWQVATVETTSTLH